MKKSEDTFLHPIEAVGLIDHAQANNAMPGLYDVAGIPQVDDSRVITGAVYGQARSIEESGRNPRYVWLSARARHILKCKLISQTRRSARYAQMSEKERSDLLALYEKEGVARIGPLLVRPIEDAITIAPGGDIFVSVHDLSDPRVTVDVERPGVLPSVDGRLYTLETSDEVEGSTAYHAPPRVLEFGDGR